MKTTSVIGAGTWGTAIANLLALKGFKVKLWAREEEVVKSINSKKINNLYLPKIKLSPNIIATSDINEAIDYIDIIVNAVPVQFIRDIFSKIRNLPKNRIVLNLSKGIEIKTLKTPSEILKEFFGENIYVLSGPNFAIEIAQKKPAATTIAGPDKNIRKKLQKIFFTNYFRVYENDDMIGCEIAGALKNVIAIAAGMCDALSLGYNTKAALITRGLNEIRKLGKAKGARDITFLGLAGIGDLVLTCNSIISRNYQAGYQISKNGRFTDKIHIAEGIYTAKAAYLLSKKLKVDMPITKEVFNVIYKNKKPIEALNTLMKRSLKSEFK